MATELSGFSVDRIPVSEVADLLSRTPSLGLSSGDRDALARDFLSRTSNDLPLGSAIFGKSTITKSTGGASETRFETLMSLLSGTGISPKQQQGPATISGKGIPTTSNRTGISRTPSAGGIGATPANLRALSSQEDQRADVRILNEPLQEIIALATQIAAAGGTPQAKQASADLARTRASLQETIDAFSPARAQQLAQGVVDGIFRELREQIAPQINAVAEAGGASRGALRALLLQDAEARSGEAAARAVLEALASLGQVQAQAATALSGAAVNDPVSNELIRLIQAAPVTQSIKDVSSFSSTGSRSRSSGNVLTGLPLPTGSGKTRIV